MVINFRTCRINRVICELAWKFIVKKRERELPFQLRRPAEGIEYPENNAADNDEADNIKSNQGVRQVSAPLSSTDNVVDMDTKNQLVN